MRRFFAADCFPVLGPMVVDHLATGGKRLRARLAYEASLALGCGVSAHAAAWAAACEIMHNATLVHDDLQDGDTTRRGAPTVWATHGAAQAINAGDLMLLAPMQLLHQSDIDRPTVGRLIEVMVQGMLEVIEGQAQECAMTAQGMGSIDGYTRMVRGKTAALFALPVRGAALLAGLEAAQAERLAAAFMPLGELFQMQDDVLDLWGHKGRNVAGSDLYEGKVSALVVYHLEQRPHDAAWLSALLLKPRAATTPQEVQRAIELFVSSGARQRVLGRIVALAQTAQEVVDARLQHLLATLIEQVMAPIAHLLDDSARTPAREVAGAAR